MRKVRFASEIIIQQDPDISHWPGVYVNPGDFRPAAANVGEDREAWIRYRSRYKRFQTHRHLPRAERRRRRWEILGFPDGHRRFRRS